MGVERSYQAVPGDSDLIDRARADVEFGTALEMLGYFFREGGNPWRGPPLSAASAEVQRVVRSMLAQDPALASRRCELDKCWDQVHYLLSATRREVAPPYGAPSLFDVACSGDAVIAEHVRGSQGHRYRYNSPAVTAVVAAALEPVDGAALRSFCNAEAMEGAGVYKMFGGRESEEGWTYLLDLVGQLTDFYADAARHGNGVLVLTD